MDAVADASAPTGKVDLMRKVANRPLRLDRDRGETKVMHELADDQHAGNERISGRQTAMLAERKLAPVLDAISTDLRRFVARGGKLILWHGWNDPAVSAYDTVDYYVRVVDALGSEAARRAVRLFMVPGVEHGRGGPGTDQFGQFAGGTGDPERSVAAAMQRWVERGISPECLIASRAPDPKNAAAPARTRPLCAWPLSACYRGTGSTDDAANFDCVNVRR